MPKLSQLTKVRMSKMTSHPIHLLILLLGAYYYYYNEHYKPQYHSPALVV